MEDKISSQEIKQFIADHSDLIDRVNQAVMEEDFHAVKNVYMDLNVLKDTRMGLLLSLSDATQVEYLRKGLASYNIRPDRSFTSTYPDFPISEEELKKMYADPKYSDQIIDHSPDTQIGMHLPAIIKPIIASNNRVKYYNHVGITINIYPLSETPLVKCFEHLFQTHFNKEMFKVKFISTRPKSLPASFWKMQQLIWADDMLHLCQPDSGLYAPLLQQQAMMPTWVYAAPVADSAKLAEWKEQGADFTDRRELETRFRMTELYFSVCCHFKFVWMEIPT